MIFHGWALSNVEILFANFCSVTEAITLVYGNVLKTIAAAVVLWGFLSYAQNFEVELFHRAMEAPRLFQLCVVSWS